MSLVYKYNWELEFTEVYKKHRDDHPAIREAVLLKKQFPYILQDIRDDELFAGRASYRQVGFSAQEGGFGYFCHFKTIEKELNREDLDPDYRSSLEEMLEYWQKESTHRKVWAEYPQKLNQAIPSDNWDSEPGVAFPLYRLAGAYLNFEKLLNKGIPGLLNEIKKCKVEAMNNDGDVELYTGLEMAIELFKDSALYYAEKARKKAGVTQGNRRVELLEIAQILEKITFTKPETLREALQLTWLYIILSEVRNYGRMDVYLGNFLARDLAKGILSRKEALKLLENLWLIMARRETIMDGRVVLGGKDRKNVEEADQFALLALEATRIVKEVEPQLSLRIYKGMNPLVKEKAFQVIGEGRTYPILYNDDVNIEAVMKAFDLPEREAAEYLPFGCGEYIINHRSYGTPSGVINMLKALEVTMHNGIDPVSGKKMGISLGDFKDFKSFSDFIEAYQKQIEYFIEVLAKQEEIEYMVAGREAPYLFMSLLYDDCLKKGKGIFNGGIRYLGGTVETYGNINTADSLTAIKKLIFEDKVLTASEMLKAIDNNFNGYGRELKLMLSAPKYGNDDDYADEIAVMLHNHVCRTAQKQKENTNLHSYLVVLINNSGNTTLGRWTGASPDGRKAGEPMANANNPMNGQDRNGLTAMFNSLLKLDPSIHAGAVQNIKISKQLFQKQSEKIKALLEVYFKNGGTQAMITVVDQEELHKALEQPENYQDLFVRVGGFTARFVELPQGVKKDILTRTLY